MRIVEVDGIKLEIDERTARTIESYKVGDPVKVLVKSYGESYNIYPGVIVGFADFKELPCIELMYADGNTFSSDTLKFATLNAKSQDIEIAPLNEAEVILDKERIADKFDKAIAKAEAEADDLRTRKTYFLNRFAKAFGEDVRAAS